ncbi:MAG: polyprenyl diphosphate synthase [Anaerolineae bacterium]
MTHRFEELIREDPRLLQRLERLDPDRLPGHVAVIMDGNGRWAAGRGLPRVEGHRAGTRSVRQVIEYSARLGISTLTLYAFSAENWKRPREEVNTLWALLREYLRRELKTLQQHRIRFRAIGRLQQLPAEVRAELDAATEQTLANEGLQLVVALNYSGRLELVDAVQGLIDEGAERATEESVESHLYTAGLPDLDLLIRTSGEMRLSNFLLWQAAYSEIYCTPVLWPDFAADDLRLALESYARRERRFGLVPDAADEGRPRGAQAAGAAAAVAEGAPAAADRGGSPT